MKKQLTIISASLITAFITTSAIAHVADYHPGHNAQTHERVNAVTNWGPMNGMSHWGPMNGIGNMGPMDGNTNWGPFNGKTGWGPMTNANNMANESDWGFHYNNKNKTTNNQTMTAQAQADAKADATAKMQADAKLQAVVEAYADAYAKSRAETEAKIKADAYTRGYADGESAAIDLQELAAILESMRVAKQQAEKGKAKDMPAPATPTK